MSNGTEKMNITVRFKEEVSEEKQQAMWAKFFDAIGLFKKGSTGTSEMPRIARKKDRTHKLSSPHRKAGIER